MPSVNLPGLGSGLDSAALIAQLLSIDARSQTLLKNKATSITTSVTALQGLNTALAALAKFNKDLAAPGGLDFYTATSSSTKATAVAGAGAENGSIDLVVDKLAQTQSGVTAPMTEWSDPAVVTIVDSKGVAKEITAASGSLDDVIKAVNASGTGVTASKVASGTLPDGTVQYRLQFSGKEPGADGAFTVYSGTEADVTAGTATNVLTQPGAATIRSAQDASATLWKGTAAEQVITSKTNTFTDLLPGVSVTVSGVSADPLTITVARDTAKTSAKAASMISDLNAALAYISIRTVSTKSTDADGKPILSGGAFTGDSTTRAVTKDLLAAASAPVDGHSPSEFGISITKTGTMEFSAEKFDAAFAKDPVGTLAAVAEIASRLAAVGEKASDKTTGSVSTKITGQETTIASLKDQVDKWDKRLEARKVNLERYYTAFDVKMGTLNAQMTWLTSQVDALNAVKG